MRKATPQRKPERAREDAPARQFCRPSLRSTGDSRHCLRCQSLCDRRSVTTAACHTAPNAPRHPHRLAVVERFELSELLCVALHEIGQFVQQLCALESRHVLAPCRVEGLARRGDGDVDILRGAWKGVRNGLMERSRGRREGTTPGRSRASTREMNGQEEHAPAVIEQITSSVAGFTQLQNWVQSPAGTYAQKTHSMVSFESTDGTN